MYIDWSQAVLLTSLKRKKRVLMHLKCQQRRGSKRDTQPRIEVNNGPVTKIVLKVRERKVCCQGGESVEFTVPAVTAAQFTVTLSFHPESFMATRSTAV